MSQNMILLAIGMYIIWMKLNSCGCKKKEGFYGADADFPLTSGMAQFAKTRVGRKMSDISSVLFIAAVVFILTQK